MLPFQLDRLISAILAQQPPGCLTFERSHTQTTVTYLVRIQQADAVMIDIESAIDPRPIANLRFTTLTDDESAKTTINRIQNHILTILEAQDGPLQLADLTSDDTLPSEIGLSTQYQGTGSRPWELIPDHLWDRVAVRLWCLGRSNQEIGRRLHLRPRTVTNRIGLLRKLYPLAGIPTHQQLRKDMFQDDSL